MIEETIFYLNWSELNEGGVTKETKVASISASMAAKEDTNQNKTEIFCNQRLEIIVSINVCLDGCKDRCIQPNKDVLSLLYCPKKWISLFWGLRQILQLLVLALLSNLSFKTKLG